jgi:hypothetical protein
LVTLRKASPTFVPLSIGSSGSLRILRRFALGFRGVLRRRDRLCIRPNDET